MCVCVCVSACLRVCVSVPVCVPVCVPVSASVCFRLLFNCSIPVLAVPWTRGSLWIYRRGRRRRPCVTAPPRVLQGGVFHPPSGRAKQKMAALKLRLMKTVTVCAKVSVPAVAPSPPVLLSRLYSLCAASKRPRASNGAFLPSVWCDNNDAVRSGVQRRLDVILTDNCPRSFNPRQTDSVRIALHVACGESRG